MKLGTLTITAGVLGIGLAAWIAPGFAQGPLYDTVKVNLPYTVTVGDRTLEPGEYEIRQNHDASGGSRILLIYSDKGMKFETSAMTIPALDPNTARQTEVILNQVGNDYYMSKMWVQGKDYGYQFPEPSTFKEREKERVTAVNVPATYSTSQGEATAMASLEATKTQDQTAAAVTDRPAPANPPVATTPTYGDSNSANREVPEQAPAPAADNTPATPDRMPATSAGWLMMVLGGGSLSGLGLALRRRRQ